MISNKYVIILRTNRESVREQAVALAFGRCGSIGRHYDDLQTGAETTASRGGQG
jgi:hypothetical protein